jgi:hypothetical protein
MALRLRDQAVAEVRVQVAAVGPRGAASVLREALSLGADRARLLLTEADAIATDSAGAALATIVRSDGPFDLILGGGGKPEQEDGLLARITAAALGTPIAESAEQLAVHFTEDQSEALLLGSDQQRRVRSLPVAIMVDPALALRPFTITGYLSGLTKPVEVERGPRRWEPRPVALAGGSEAPESGGEGEGVLLQPAEAAVRLLHEIGMHGRPATSGLRYEGEIDDLASPTGWSACGVAILAGDAQGRLEATAEPTVRGARLLAAAHGLRVTVLLLAPLDEEIQRRAVGQVRSFFPGDVCLLATEHATPEVRARLLRECWPQGPDRPRVVVGEPWTEPAMVSLALAERDESSPYLLALRVRRLNGEGERVVLETVRAQGKLVARQTVSPRADTSCWIGLTAEMEVGEIPSLPEAEAGKVWRWSPRLERFFGREEIQRLLDEVKTEAGVARLADAEFIIDVGSGIGNRDGYEEVIEPLEKALRGLGVANLVIGGSRKVTEELHLLPADRQIGQSGVSVNPRILLAIGISGAPQHLNYIGPRATIISFNRDAEAPIMALNRRQPRPRVFPVVGDLFETVPALIAALREQPAAAGELSPQR